jgi:tRNA nucleotidyltransferase (CCA-adding enzyme)
MKRGSCGKKQKKRKERGKTQHLYESTSYTGFMQFNDILAKYAPTKEDQQQLQSQIQEVVKKINVKDAKVLVGGSGGKNTWLKGTHDIDLYVMFEYKKYKDKSDQLADLLHAALKKSFKSIVRLHGSRDYFQIKKEKYTFEIVPILNIKNDKEARNTTDLSQLHVAYVKKHAKIVNDIRLAKIFARAQNMYGAESYQRGFSGYCLEVLVIHYGSFIKCMRAAAQWKATHTIGKKNDIAKLNAAKKVSPLILIDPVQPDRNVAAALSREKYDCLRVKAKEFIKRPSQKYFERQQIDLKKYAKRGKVIVLEALPLSGKKDIIGAKMLKAFEWLKENLEKNDFTMASAQWEFNHESISYIYFVIEKKQLSDNIRHDGPPRTQEKALELFKKKYGKISFEKEKSFVMLPRKYKTAEECIEHLIQDQNVQDRVKEIKIVAMIE